VDNGSAEGEFLSHGTVILMWCFGREKCCTEWLDFSIKHPGTGEQVLISISCIDLNSPFPTLIIISFASPSFLTGSVVLGMDSLPSNVNRFYPPRPRRGL
jgi:hypothetical protein